MKRSSIKRENLTAMWVDGPADLFAQRAFAVQLLGERVLLEPRTHQPVMSVESVQARCKKGEAFICIWLTDGDLLAALVADKAASGD